MLKHLLFISALLMVGTAISQDTTYVRLVGIDSGSDLIFFDSDTLDMTTLTPDAGTAVGHAIFADPDSNVVHLLAGNGSAQRDFYTIEPFLGTTSSTLVSANQYYNTADITSDGRIFAMTGNGAATPAQVVEVDLAAGTETVVATSNAPAGLAWAIEYNPDSSQLYIFAANDLAVAGAGVYTMEVDTWTQGYYTSIFDDSEVHGALRNVNGDYIITCYGGEIWNVDNGTFAGSNNITSSYAIMDIEQLDLIIEDDAGLCPNAASVIDLTARYASNSYKWYMDGVEMPTETTNTLSVSAAGTYRVLYEIGSGTGFYMFSEEVTITEFAVPVVTITQAINDTALCPGDTIVLQGANGGTLQWYLDGNIIVGANANTYGATVAGVYQQMKTNMSGCSDTAAVAYVIIDDPNCSNSINEVNTSFEMYPNPTNEVINITSVSLIESIVITDVKGVIVKQLDKTIGTENKIDVSELIEGLYFVQVYTNNGASVKTLIRQ